MCRSSSRHCDMSETGVRTSARRTSPRSTYSLRMSPASMVLPRPTSSARMARPRSLAQHPETGLELEVVAIQIVHGVQGEEILESPGQREAPGLQARRETRARRRRRGPCQADEPLHRRRVQAEGFRLLEGEHRLLGRGGRFGLDIGTRRLCGHEGRR